MSDVKTLQKSLKKLSKLGEELKSIKQGLERIKTARETDIGFWWHHHVHGAGKVTGFEKEADRKGFVVIYLQTFSKRNPDGVDIVILSPYSLYNEGWQPITEERAERLIKNYKRLAAKERREGTIGKVGDEPQSDAG